MPVVIMLHMMMQPVMCLGETSRARPPAAQALTRLAIDRYAKKSTNKRTPLDISWPHYVHIIETPWDGSGPFHFPYLSTSPSPSPAVGRAARTRGTAQSPQAAGARQAAPPANSSGWSRICRVVVGRKKNGKDPVVVGQLPLKGPGNMV